jgi:hypothetical protein
MAGGFRLVQKTQNIMVQIFGGLGSAVQTLQKKPTGSDI